MEVLRVLSAALAILISIPAAVWVWDDSKRLKSVGANLTPSLWAIMTLLAWLPSLAAYLLVRRFKWQVQLEDQGRKLPALRSVSQAFEPETRPVKAEEAVSEASIRSLAKSLHHLPRNQALATMRDAYYQASDSDSMDIGRFEELAIQALREVRAAEH